MPGRRGGAGAGKQGWGIAANVASAKLTSHTVAMFAAPLTRMPSIIAALWLVLGTFASPLPTAIAENSVSMPLYREGRDSPDSIGNFYQAREIASAIGSEGAPC